MPVYFKGKLKAATSNEVAEKYKTKSNQSDGFKFIIVKEW